MEKVNLRQKFDSFTEQWSPRIAGELNGQQVKLVKFLGPFVWHHHDNEDELFLVVKGRMLMRFRDRDVWVEEGEFIIVPRSWITKGGTCRTRWAGLRNTATEESINLRRIARIDATIEGAAAGCTGRRRCR